MTTGTRLEPEDCLHVPTVNVVLQLVNLRRGLAVLTIRSPLPPSAMGKLEIE